MDRGSRAELSPAKLERSEAFWGRSPKEVVKKHPESYQSYNTLALALTQRGRETADPIFYARAEKAIGESFRLAPDNFEGEKIRVWLLLEKHEFAQALKKAQALNRRAPDDVLVYGYLADAHIHLGNYEEAEEAAQWTPAAPWPLGGSRESPRAFQDSWDVPQTLLREAMVP